jgi:hypothetical protein
MGTLTTNPALGINETRFWSKVAKRGPDECWEWQASLNQAGYGQFAVVTTRPKRNDRAHRVSWILQFGEIPDNLCVLHKCDNPKCVNPNHLFLGTRRDNIHDCIAKGRYRIGCRHNGEAHHRALLTEDDVREIRKLQKAKPRPDWILLGKKLGVHPSTISRAACGRTWSHLK